MPNNNILDKELPEKLYKYREINEYTLRTLTHRELKFSSAYEFNDPFEGHPIIQINSTDKTSNKYLHNLLKSHGIKSPVKRLQLVPAMKRNLARPNGIEDFPWLRDMLLNVGIFSLSEVCNNILMWSHYAKNHTGICLEFDAYSHFFATS